MTRNRSLLKWMEVAKSGIQAGWLVPVLSWEPMDGLSSQSGRLRMTAVFRGRFECKIDPKGRIKIPSNYRRCMFERDSSVVITNGQYQGQRCLEICSVTEWEVLESKIGRLPSLRREVQAFRRFYLSGAHILSVDAQDRLLIPQSLRHYAGLQENAVLVGMGSKFEIWSAEAWKLLYDNMAENFGEVLEEMAALDRLEMGES
ncbi:MAG: division/cell wall cluster transcriptional repressor MraZ [Bdellovibrionales bacterium]|nr:division/cell wall cluster transcriptional repressor MraZ [Bdellovibrionales bacterium]